MHALHSTLLPSSSITHSLYLPNFTPSTIYPLPRPLSHTTELKVVGNLIVAGFQDLRVFEIREELVPLPEKAKINGDVDAEMGGGELEDGFFDNGPIEVKNHAFCMIMHHFGS